MRKKIIPLIIGAAVILQSALGLAVYAENAGASAAEAVQVSEERAEMLRSLGVLYDLADDETEDLTKEVSRAEYAKILVKYFNKPYSCATLTQKPYIDVELTNEYARDIKTIKDLGYVADTETQSFRPQDTVTLNEAAAMLMRGLGYTYLSDEKALSAATELRVFSGISKNRSEGATLDNIYAMLENTLSAGIVETEWKNGSISYKSSDEKTVLSEYYEIKKMRGVVTANDLTGLSEASKAAGEAQIEIDGKVYGLKYKKCGDYLGYVVDFYLKSEESEDVIYAVPNNKNNVTEISSEELYNADNTQIYYRRQKKDNKTLKLEENYDVIYNKKAYSGYGQLKNILPEEGSITAIDNDNNGRADVLLITSYEFYMVSDIYARDKKVYTTDGNYTIDLNEDRLNVEIRNTDGNMVNFAAVKKNCVLTVSESRNTDGEKMVSVIISDKKTDGTLRSKSDDTVTIDTTEYPATKAFLEKNDRINIIKTGATQDLEAIYEELSSDLKEMCKNSIEELNGLSDSQIEALGFNKDEIDALKDYRSQLYESNQALLEMRRTITDKVSDTFDTFNEKVSESYEEFDKYNDVLEKYTDIVDLLGTKTDAATKRLVKTLRDTQLQNLRNQSVSAKEIYEGALANYNLAEKQYNDAVARYGANSIEAQQMEEIMKQAADARDDAYSNWLDAYQASLEKAREIYEAEMEELQKDFERSLTGIYGTFNLFDTAYERAKELKDNYLPEYEKIYELNKLNRDIQKEIDNSSSLRDKKALRQLQDEINRKQEAGVQLSKYEVEEMRKKFELEQARMNLEDARNSKSEVRLTRDQNGNWGYVYTASENKVADAEQKYEDALYQYQKLSDDYITDLDEKIKDLTKNTQERLDEVREALEEGLIDIDQAEQQKQDILNNFYAQQSYLISQFKGATDSLASSLGLMDELYGQQAELVDTLPETTFGQVSSVGSMEEWAAKSSEEILKYAEESAKAYERLQTTNQEIADQNKLNLSDIETATNNVAKSSEKTQQKVSETVQALADSFKSTMGALATWDQTYATTIQNAIGQNELFITSLNNVIAKLGLIATYEMKDLYEYIDYLSSKGSKGETITEAEWKKLDEIRQKYAVNYSKESMAPFDTGGYTGEWGDEGKIAILHEKEYVLNADLTARFFDALKTFSLVDQFVNTENQIQQQQLQIETLEALSNYIDQLADRMNTTTINPNDFSASLFNSGNQQLEQNVHIEASFPNVTQSSEIEMAFDNLVNKASQYINRKNMSSMTFQDSYLSPV